MGGRDDADARGRGQGADAPLLGHWTTVAGGRIFARVADGALAVGSGPPIVMVHGLGVSSRYLLPTARLLARRGPVLVPDLPGHGRSERPAEILDVGGLAEALLGWLEAMAVGPAVFFGNSLGCQTVVELAGRRPERACALVLTGPTGDPEVRALPRWLGRLVRDLPREPASLISMEAADYLRAGPWRVYRTARAMVGDPFAAKLPLIRQPTLVVRGERDPIATQGWVEEVTGLLPRGRLAVVPDAGHAVNYNSPGPVAAMVVAFMEELGLGRAGAACP